MGKRGRKEGAGAKKAQCRRGRRGGWPDLNLNTTKERKLQHATRWRRAIFGDGRCRLSILDRIREDVVVRTLRAGSFTQSTHVTQVSRLSTPSPARRGARMSSKLLSWVIFIRNLEEVRSGAKNQKWDVKFIRLRIWTWEFRAKVG